MDKKMKALVFHGVEDFKVERVESLPLLEGQARIKVSYCGLCGTDLSIYKGKHPRAKSPLIIGHEFIGIIEEICGNEGTFREGDKVAAYPLVSCKECYPCRNGMEHVCNQLKLIGIDSDGGMAQYVNCNTNSLIKLPSDISEKAAALIEPLAVAVHGIHRSGFKPLDTVAIVGAGPVGVIIGIVLKHCGASRIIISDISEMRLDLCREFGFESVNSQNTSLSEYINQTSEGIGVDIVYECAGVKDAAMEMTSICRTGGTICVVSVYKDAPKINLAEMHYKELNLVATRVYAKEELFQAAKYVKTIEKELEKVVTHIVPLRDSEKIFTLNRKTDQLVMKIIVDCK